MNAHGGLLPPLRTANEPNSSAALWGFVCLLAHCANAAVVDTSQNLDDAWSFGYSGELRERFETVRNPVFGLDARHQDDYLLHRIALSADARYNDRVRVFAEAVSGTTSGWRGTPPPTQDDPLDVLQAFGEASFRLADGQLAVRGGRQELSLGSSRLVSVRESPNIRRTFDGVRARWASGANTRVDAFLVRHVSPQNGHFDDRSSSDQAFWGIYATKEIPWPAGMSADIYYLGLKREQALFANTSGDERRHTVGARLFGQPNRWDWNFEGAWQWGRFGDSRIRAWTLSADIGYAFPDLTWSPRLGLKADVISGDADLDDRTLGTFNPLFPKLPYFSEANLATPANLLDIQPSLALALSDRTQLSVSWNGLWKYAREDAFYAPPLTPVPNTERSSSRYIGHQSSAAVEWTPLDWLTLAATYVYFEPGAFIREAGGKDGSFGTLWIQLRF